MGSIKNFFVKIKPSKRKLIQLYAALLYNAQMKGFITGSIFTGKTKSWCLPGMNCYSCPGAIGACPLGSLQNALAESKTKAPTYVLGIILLYCITLGRWICGWLCPGGFLQELLYKIKSPKLRKSKVTRALSYFKYVLLFVMVIGIPLMFGLSSDRAVPAFCKFICPIGTFEGGIFLLINPNNKAYFVNLGPLFTWKFCLLVGFIVASIFIYRFFCRFFCPLGAIYGIFNKLSILGIKVDKTKCNSCGSCVSHCKMDVKQVGDHECIMCGECIDTCHAHAIDWKLISKKIKEEKEGIEDSNSLEATNPEYVIGADKKESKFSSFVKKIGKRKIVNGCVTVLMILVLVGAFVYSNVNWKSSNLIPINSKVEVANVSLNNGESLDIVNNTSSSKLLYFFDEYSEEDDKLIKSLKLSHSDLDVVVISSYKNKDLNKTYYDEDGIYNGYDDTSSTLLSKFSSEIKYPFYAVIDNENTLKYAHFGEAKEYVLEIAVSGASIGNNPGDFSPVINIKKIDREGNESDFDVTMNKGKITVVNFWATWCGPCIEELPYFNALNNKYSNDLLDVVVVHDGNSYIPKTVLGKMNSSSMKDYTFDWAYDDVECSYYKSLGGLDSYPTTTIIDQNGYVVFNKIGSITFDEIDTIVQSLLTE